MANYQRIVCGFLPLGTDQGVVAALVSGHDADSLLCLTVVYRRETR